MYTNDDFRAANRCFRRCCAVYGIVLALAVVLYVVAILAGMRMGMLLVLILAFLFAVFYGDLKLMPVIRWRKFMLEMQKGLRRNLECTVDVRSKDTQMQDGLRVYAQQVRLSGGDTRLFYLNADHAQIFPELGTSIRLESYGRHITGFALSPEEGKPC